MYTLCGAFSRLHYCTVSHCCWVVHSGCKYRRQTGVSDISSVFQGLHRSLWCCDSSAPQSTDSPRMPRVKRYDTDIIASLRKTQTKARSFKSCLLIVSSHLLIVFSFWGQAVKLLSVFWLFVAINTRLIHVPLFPLILHAPFLSLISVSFVLFSLFNFST